MAERSRVAMTVTFQNVPVHKADDVPALLISTLQNIVNNEDIDMERMKGLIQKEKLKVMIVLKPIFSILLLNCNILVFG
jgi:Zn-dependent M16 (insulinase) family peptidase